ncbi:MAG: NINE protein [Spirochaetales bacterium]|nr:NINE protein [Spirochaetales bacterium]
MEPKMSFFSQNKYYFPNDSIGAILKAFNKLSEANLIALISSCKFKNPNTMLVVSIVLGWLGIDRFMIGSIGMGILKLLCSIIVIFATDENISENIFMLAYIAFIIRIILWIIDIFVIKKATREKNLEILARNFKRYFNEDLFKNRFEHNENANTDSDNKNENKLKEELQKSKKEKISELENKAENNEQ